MRSRDAGMKLAIFDCDGTLVDGQANICRAVEEVFAGAGRDPPSRHAIRRIVGLSLTEAMCVLAPGDDAAFHHALAEDYRAVFRRLRGDGGLADEPLYDGMSDVLASLIHDGWTLGVATGKSDRGLAHVLARHGIADRFATLQTADRHPSKPDPAMLVAAMDAVGARPEESVMIGDTSYDMTMACAAGVRAIGVAWGYHAADELVAAGAHAVATDVASLPDHLA